jgi:hypothetical protein
MTEFCECTDREYPREFVWRRAQWSSAEHPLKIQVHSRCDRPVYSAMERGALLSPEDSRRWTSRRVSTFR